MENTGYIGLSRQMALRREMDVIANNIANMNSTAYKDERMMFVEHLVKSREQGSIAPAKLSFVRDVGEIRNLANGAIEKTGNTFDLAIRGEGYFVVDTSDGLRYTRNGQFRLDDQGRLVTQKGQPVLSNGGAPIFLSPADTNIQIAKNGTISSENGDIGQLRIVTFQNERDLKKIGDGLMRTDEQPADANNPTVIQHSLEKSNVEPISELTRMIEVHRAYDNVKNLLDKEDRRLRQLIETMTQER